MRHKAVSRRDRRVVVVVVGNFTLLLFEVTNQAKYNAKPSHSDVTSITNVGDRHKAVDRGTEG